MANWHKAIHGLLVATLFYLPGCTLPTKLSSEQVNQFRKQMKQEMRFIKDITFQFRPTTIEIVYTLTKKLDSEEQKKIFMQTRALANTEQFNQVLIQGQYKKKYREQGEPKLNIEFDEDGNRDYENRISCPPESPDSSSAENRYVKCYYYSYQGDSTSGPYPPDP